MKKPVKPEEPSEEIPHAGGRAFGRARQFAQSRGLPEPNPLPEAVLATAKKNAPKKPGNKR